MIAHCRLNLVAAACVTMLMPGRPASAERYEVEARQLQLHDDARNRPVRVDVWAPRLPAPLSSEARSDSKAQPGAAAGAGAARRFPVILMSHGAMGSALSYARFAASLASHGFVVAGVSHYGESWIYGPATIDPAAVLRLWDRPPDLSFALDQLAKEPALAPLLDLSRVAALGHSSGGNTAIALGGARLDRTALMAYCKTEAAKQDRGCDYAANIAAVETPAAAGASYRDVRVRAIVAFDPAAGPGYGKESLAAVTVPVLIVGAVDNDFLPFEQHARRYAENLPNATLIALDHGEGHFVFLDPCALDLAANGVPLCKDRPGVDRAAVHQRLVEEVVAFLRHALD